jgi:hypothetical protein
MINNATQNPEAPIYGLMTSKDYYLTLTLFGTCPDSSFVDFLGSRGNVKG